MSERLGAEVDLLERDWEFILDSVYRINLTKDIPTFAQESLACLCTLIPCVQGTFFPFSEERGFYDAYCIGKKANRFDEFLNGDYQDDLYFKLMTVKTFPCSFRDSDLVPENIFLKSRLYNEIYVPEGIYWALRIELMNQDRLSGQYALFNTKEQGDFTERDVRIGNLFARHLSLKLDSLQLDEGARSEQKLRIEQLAEAHQLTQREAQVAELVAEGMADSEIAELLFVSLSTVKKHLYNAYAKLRVNNRAQLVSLVSGHGRK